jgi:hypothetical protein
MVTMTKYEYVKIIGLLLFIGRNVFLCFIGAEINKKADEETDIGFSDKYTPPKEREMHKYAKYPLLTAIERCHPEVVSLLISHGAEIDIVKISNNGTALHVACQSCALLN